MSPGPHVSARRAVWTSFIVDLVDITVNALVAIISGSVVMLAEALQGLADLFCSTMLLIGVGRADRRATVRYRFGYGRELFFWVLISAIFMLFVTGGLSFFFGLERLLHPEPIHHAPWALVALLVNFSGGSYALWISLQRLVGEHGGHLWHYIRTSTRLEAKSTAVLDLIAVTSSIWGLFALTIYVLTGDSRFDGLGAMVVGLSTALLASLLIIEVKDFLVGRGADRAKEEQVVQTTEAVEGVEEVERIKSMYLGTEHLLINLEVRFSSNIRLDRAEEIIETIKSEIRRTLPEARQIWVEAEPPEG